MCAPGLGVPTRESRTSFPGLRGPALSPQYIDAISSKQGDLENYVSDGYKTALTEERRRFCFLVEKQCAVAKNSAAYHSKVSCPPAWAVGRRAFTGTSGPRGRGSGDSGQARGCGAA